LKAFEAAPIWADELNTAGKVLRKLREFWPGHQQ